MHLKGSLCIIHFVCLFVSLFRSGCGPTAVFLAIDYLLEQAKQEDLVDFYGCVNLLRADRFEMVQTLVIFFEVLLLEMLSSYVDFNID